MESELELERNSYNLWFKFPDILWNSSHDILNEFETKPKSCLHE